MSDKAVFSIAYAGPSLDDGSMDVKDFAPALLALGDLIDAANKTINAKSDSKIQVRVRADFKKGSFDVTLEVVRSLLEQISIALGSEVSLSDLLALLGIAGSVSLVGVKSLLSLIKAIRGRKIEKARQIENQNVELHFTDNSETIITSINVFNLYVNPGVQKAAQGIVKPLEKSGIDHFSIYDCPAEAQNDAPTFSVTTEEAPYFKDPEYTQGTTEPEILVQNRYQGAYSLITVQFEEGYKWRLSNGQDRLTATLKDADFIKKIEENRISFSKDDILIVEISTTQWRNPDGTLKIENEIAQVLEHIKKKEQIPIPFEKSE